MKRISFDFAAAGAVFLAVILVPLILTTVLAQSSGDDPSAKTHRPCEIFDGIEYCPPPHDDPTPEPTPVPTPACTIHYLPFPPWEYEDCGDEATPVPDPTDTPVPDPTDTPVPDPTDTPVPDPTDTPVPDPTDTPVPDPTDTPVPVPTATPRATPRPSLDTPSVTSAATVVNGVAAITLSWTEDSNADGYQVQQLDTSDTENTDIVCRSSGGPGTNGPRCAPQWRTFPFTDSNNISYSIAVTTSGNQVTATVSGATHCKIYSHRMRSYKNVGGSFQYGSWEQVSTTQGSTVTITANNAMVTEGQEVRFTLSSGCAPTANLDISVAVRETGGPFLTGTTPSTITIGKGSTSAQLILPTEDDAVVESDGQTAATIQSGTGYSVGTPSSASVTVEDNEPTVTITANDASVTEGEEVRFTLRAVPAPTSVREIQVGVNEEGGPFLTGNIPSIITISKDSPTAQLILQTENDSVDEPDGKVIAEILPDTDGEVNYSVGTDRSDEVDVQNDHTRPPATLAAPTLTGRVENGTVELDWNDVPNATGYKVEQCVSDHPLCRGNVWVEIKVINDPTSSRATITGLAPDVYNYQVRAYRTHAGSDEHSPYSNQERLTVPLLIPTGLNSRPHSMNKLVLDWDDVPGVGITYEVQQKKPGGDWTTLASDNFTLNGFSSLRVITFSQALIGGLEDTATYEHRVKSVKGRHSSEWSKALETRLPLPHIGRQADNTVQYEFGTPAMAPAPGGPNSDDPRTVIPTAFCPSQKRMEYRRGVAAAVRAHLPGRRLPRTA